MICTSALIGKLSTDPTLKDKWDLKTPQVMWNIYGLYWIYHMY